MSQPLSVAPIRFQALARDRGRPSFRVPPPLALYVHLPWCLRKCPYCDFNSHGLREGDDLAALESAYVDALIADLEASLPQVWGRRIISIFFGGGTPSLFSPEALDRLLAAIRALLPVEADAEITLEANPGTFEQARFAAYRALGINRLSLGIQSFDDTKLKALGRVHDGAQARAAVASAAALFERFNLDLMFALPGQTLAQLDADLDTALSFGPSHLSVYHLSLEPNTLFAGFPPPLPDDDLAADMQDRVIERLGAAGLARYEISAFARPGHRSRHNLNYWSFGDYLGIGAGAHGKLSFHDRIVRQVRYRHPSRYLQAAQGGAITAGIHGGSEAHGENGLVGEGGGVGEGGAVELAHEVTADEVGFEFMLNALRLVDGVPVDLFASHTGWSPALISSAIEQGLARGLIDPDPTRLKATELGLRFLNDTQALFLKAAKD